jgi:purine-cytosine permease-like protein
MGDMTIALIVIGLILLTVIGLAALMWNSESMQASAAASFEAKGGLILDESAAVDVPWIGSAFGWMLLVVGAALSIGSFFLPTSVDTYSVYGPTGVHNLGLMQTQLMVLFCGLGLFVGGIVLLGVGAIIRRMR